MTTYSTSGNWYHKLEDGQYQRWSQAFLTSWQWMQRQGIERTPRKWTADDVRLGKYTPFIVRSTVQDMRRGGPR